MMNKKIFCIFVIMLMLTTVIPITTYSEKNIQNNPINNGCLGHVPKEEWNETFGGTYQEKGYSVRQTSDGGYIIAGTTENSLKKINGYMIKTNSIGVKEWSHYRGDWDNDEFKSVQQTTDGGYIFVGSNNNSIIGGSDVWIYKTDSNGGFITQNFFGGPRNDFGYSVQQTTDEGYIILGEIYVYNNIKSYVYLIKADSMLDREWQIFLSYSSDSIDHGYSVQQTTDGGYIITGETHLLSQDRNVLLIKTDSTGAVEWKKSYGGAKEDYGECVQQTTDGGYIIVGSTESYGLGSCDIYVIKTYSNGTMEWNQTFGTTSFDYGTYVQQTKDGGYIITGYFFNVFYTDVYLLKIDRNGDELWDKTFGKKDYNDKGYCVQQTTDGGYIITGATESYGNGSAYNPDVWLIKTETDNLPPYRPSDPYPIDGATGVDINDELSWTGGDPDDLIVTYDVWVGWPWVWKIYHGITTESFYPGPLLLNTTYEWSVDAHDSSGAYAFGFWWKFTTTEVQPYVRNIIYPTDRFFERQIHKPYNIKVIVQNDGKKSYNFTYVLDYSFSPKDADNKTAYPTWDLEEKSSYTLNGTSHNFGEKVVIQVNPGETTLIFTIKNSWFWVEPWDYERLVSILIDVLCSANPVGELEIAFEVFDLVRLALDLRELLDHVWHIDYNYNGKVGFRNLGCETKLWVSPPKIGFLILSLSYGQIASLLTSAGFTALSTGVGWPVAAGLFASEAASYVTSEVYYCASVDPDKNYTNITDPEPCYVPEYDEIPDGIGKNAAELFLDMVSDSKAQTKSYTRYLGAVEAKNDTWAVKQLASTYSFGNEQIDSTQKLIPLTSNMTKSLSPLSPTEIDYLKINLTDYGGLPVLEKNMLNQLGVSNDSIDDITWLFIWADANDYLYKNFTEIPFLLNNLSKMIDSLNKKLVDETNGTNYTIANLELEINSINISSIPTKIIGYLEFPYLYNTSLLKIDSAILNENITPIHINNTAGDHDKDGIDDYAIEYYTTDILSLIPEGKLHLSVFGNIKVTSGNITMYSGASTLMINGHPPNIPRTPSGTTRGNIGTNYSYTTLTIDEEKSSIYFLFDWDDGTHSKWIGPISSGVSVRAEHIWNTSGFYEVKVKAKDVFGAESNWSKPLSITMPKSKAIDIQLFLQKLFQRFPLIEKILNQILFTN